jgi:hypothetical protein
MKADIPNPKTSDGFGSATAGHMLFVMVRFQPVAAIGEAKVRTAAVAVSHFVKLDARKQPFNI